MQKKACQQYSLNDFAKNLIILDTGHAKLMTPTSLEILRTLNGFRMPVTDPIRGERQLWRFMAMAPCDAALRVSGVENLFCRRKAGLLVGHTGNSHWIFGGHNAVRLITAASPSTA